MTRPLDGLTVLELHRYSPGQFCTMFLADFGADVIKVEEPPRLRFGAESAASRRTTLNRGKRSIVLNLKEAAGREVFLALVERADVLVEGYRPGVMARLGLDYECLRERNKRLIYCAITGYGQDGPYRLRAGHDLNYVAMGGLLGLTGPRGGAPVQLGLQMADLTAGGMPGAIGILMALAARERTGEGQFVDISMQDNAAGWLAGQVDGFSSHEPGRGQTVLNGGAAYYGVYETLDGQYVTIAALEPWFWERFCMVVERPDLVALHGQPAESGRLRRELEALFLQKSRADWDALLGSEDVCYAPVLEPLEVLKDQHLTARGVARGDQERTASVLGPTIKLGSTPADGDRPAPALGEHTAAILTDLGYEPEAIGKLINGGVCS